MRLLAALGHRFGRVVDGLARLDLDEDQRAAAARDDVDLAERRFPAPRHDPIGLGDEQHGGAAFRRQAEPERRDALRTRRRFWRLRSGSARRAMVVACSILGFFGERQRALINLAPRQAGRIGDFADGVFQRNAGERLAQQSSRFRPR